MKGAVLRLKIGHLKKSMFVLIVPLVRIPYNQILYCENIGNYIKIQLAERSFVTLNTMKALDKALKNHGFSRIHRSFIINLNKIDEINANSVIIQKMKFQLVNLTSHHF